MRRSVTGELETKVDRFPAEIVELYPWATRLGSASIAARRCAVRRTTRRRPCPQCGRASRCLGTKIPIPTKADDRARQALRSSIREQRPAAVERMERSAGPPPSPYWQRQIAELEARPANEGRVETIGVRSIFPPQETVGDGKQLELVSDHFSPRKNDLTPISTTKKAANNIRIPDPIVCARAPCSSSAATID